MSRADAMRHMQGRGRRRREGDNRLAVLAGEINRQHEAAFGAATLALKYAAECGQYLLEAKTLVAHGQWLPWLKENTTVSARQSQKYMRLAENWEAIQAKCEPGSHLSINAALSVLAEPGSATAPNGPYILDVLVPPPAQENDVVMGLFLEKLSNYVTVPSLPPDGPVLLVGHNGWMRLLVWATADGSKVFLFSDDSGDRRFNSSLPMHPQASLVRSAEVFSYLRDRGFLEPDIEWAAVTWGDEQSAQLQRTRDSVASNAALVEEYGEGYTADIVVGVAS